jgi:hypothetical protein
MKYFEEIKQVVSEYDKINAGLAELERLTVLLQERSSELNKALADNRANEKALIDKIVSETGESPDYHKIMTMLNAGNN